MKKMKTKHFNEINELEEQNQNDENIEMYQKELDELNEELGQLRKDKTRMEQDLEIEIEVLKGKVESGDKAVEREIRLKEEAK
jgi:hypothetical protein